MKFIASSLALACAVTLTSACNKTQPEATFKTQLIKVEALKLQKPQPAIAHAAPRLARVRATRSYRRPIVYRSVGTANYGRASWYTGGFGACGHALTGYYAASRTLPCGSHVRVTYGGRSIVVTIMDRGPQSPLRALDLSKSAFAALAPISKGLIWVHFQLVK